MLIWLKGFPTRQEKPHLPKKSIMTKKHESAVDLQKEIFLGGLRGDRSPIPYNMDQLRDLARSRVSSRVFDYLDGGAGREATMDNNRKALDAWKIVPSMLRDVSRRDTSVEWLGIRTSVPFFLCPIGVLELAHPEADRAVARACSLTGVPMMISSQASKPMEEISALMPDVPSFFQLYWSKSEDLVASFVQRAEASGCRAIVVTLDTTMLGWRSRDLDHAWLPFLYGMGLAQYTSDPVFNRLVINEPPVSGVRPRPSLRLVISLWQMAKNFPGSTWTNFRTRAPLQVIRKFIEIYMNPGLQWSDLHRLREMTSLPVVLKGIQHPDDARRAVDAGMDGILVSNHGGRQVDGAIGSLDALHSIKQAIGDQVTILFDSGIRTGSDAFKALALGARAIGIGRPYAYGLAVGGTTGVQQVIRGIQAEFELTMALAGCKSVSEISSGSLQRSE